MIIQKDREFQTQKKLEIGRALVKICTQEGSKTLP